MLVYLIEPTLTSNETDEVIKFKNTIVTQVGVFVAVNLVGACNINCHRTKIDSNSIIVFFSDESKTIEQGSSVYKFLEKAKQKQAQIWPIAMTKDSRLPPDIVAKNQSYDVSEQLRCRNLERNYLESIAKVFSRKIISRVLPTIYDESGMIFVSHRRLDGEEITAKLCDQIIVQSKGTNLFRDVVSVEVGNEAQKEIDFAMSKSDAFIFIHTEKSAESVWIQKELRFAILRCIPIVWVQIDNADASKMKMLPTERPHLSYSSNDLEDSSKIAEITDEIMQMTFEIIMSRSEKIFDYVGSLEELFGDQLHCCNETNLLYTVSSERKGYNYPQRQIRQHIQMFGKTPTHNDITTLQELICEGETQYDSIAVLTDRIVQRETIGNIVKETFEDYYDNWHAFLNGKMELNGKEIIISGAFPDGEEIYKQSLTDALVIFAKAIIKRGYILTFGSHPTFQELFFEIGNNIDGDSSRNNVKMYISKFFEKNYADSKKHFIDNAELIEVEKEGERNESLTNMRKAMIQRKDVAAMICLGGKIKSNKQEEGLREEVRIAQEGGVPVFLIGTVGGCSSVLASEFKDAGWELLNNASSEVNEMSMESLDYFSISQKILDVLEQ